MDSDLWIQILELVILLALSGFFSSPKSRSYNDSKRIATGIYRQTNTE